MFNWELIYHCEMTTGDPSMIYQLLPIFWRKLSPQKYLYLSPSTWIIYKIIILNCYFTNQTIRRNKINLLWVLLLWVDMLQNVKITSHNSDKSCFFEVSYFAILTLHLLLIGLLWVGFAMVIFAFSERDQINT